MARRQSIDLAEKHQSNAIQQLRLLYGTVNCDLMSCTTPACFGSFFSIYYGPYSSS